MKQNKTRKIRGGSASKSVKNYLLKLCEELCIMKVYTLCYYAKIANEQLADDKITPNHRVFLNCFLNYFNALLDFLLASGIITNEEMMEIKEKYTMYGGASARMSVNKITKYLIIFIGSCLIQLTSGFTNINKFFTQDFGSGVELRHAYAQDEFQNCVFITSAYWMFYGNQENIMPLFKDIYSGPFYRGKKSDNNYNFVSKIPHSLLQPMSPPVLEGYKDMSLSIQQYDVAISKQRVESYKNSIAMKMKMKNLIVSSIDKIDEELKKELTQEFNLIKHKQNDFYLVIMSSSTHFWLLIVSPKIANKKIIDLEICAFDPQKMVNIENYFFKGPRYLVKPTWSIYCTPGFPKFQGIVPVTTNTPVLDYSKLFTFYEDSIDFMFSLPVKMAKDDESKSPQHFLNFLKLFQTDYVHKGIQNSVESLEIFSKQTKLPPMAKIFAETLFEQQKIFFHAYEETYLDADPFAHTYKDSKFNIWKNYKRPANTPLAITDQISGISNFYIDSPDTPIEKWDQFFQYPTTGQSSKNKRTRRKSKTPKSSKDDEF
jgi:hypothetical protein